jgi:glycosyltransferase involved in cell wall biosynthesis
MDRSLRICYLTSIHPDFDGRVWRYATMLADLGHEVHLICPWDVEDGETREGATLHPFPRAQRTILRPLHVVNRIAKKLRPLLKYVDLIHFHDIDILPAMAAFSFVKPVVYDVHENYPEEMRLRGWGPKPFPFLLSHMLRISQATLARMIGNVVLVVPEQEPDFPMSKLHTLIVRNFASVKMLGRATDDYMTRPDGVIYTGSGYEANGVFLYLEIARRMEKIHPEVAFYMADRFDGAALARERVMGIIATLGNVRLVSNVRPQNVIDHLNSATIAVSADLRVPQRIRALPTKLFEYMAAGLPIVASDLPNTVDAVGGSGSGILCQPEDSDSFVRAICSLIEDRAGAYAMGKRGQDTFRQKFCWEGQGKAVERFYEEICAKQKHG